MTATIRDLITDALQDIQVLAAGETASAEDADFCLRKFNLVLLDEPIDGVAYMMLDNLPDYALRPTRLH